MGDFNRTVGDRFKGNGHNKYSLLDLKHSPPGIGDGSGNIFRRHQETKTAPKALVLNDSVSHRLHTIMIFVGNLKCRIFIDLNARLFFLGGTLMVGALRGIKAPTPKYRKYVLKSANAADKVFEEFLTLTEIPTSEGFQTIANGWEKIATLLRPETYMPNDSRKCRDRPAWCQNSAKPSMMVAFWKKIKM
jgi:hypothetical protein